MEKYNFNTTDKSTHIDPVEEANRRYAEKLKVERTVPAYDYRKLELFTQMANEYELALNACGLEFIKNLCSIDQELAHNILSILSQAVENDNFENVEMSFRKIIYKKLEEEEINSRKYR